MIDIHSHILPGLDDGAAEEGESLEMARIAVSDGVTTMIATPHYDHPHFGTDVARADAARARLIQLLERDGIPLRIEPGGEITLSAHTRDSLGAGRLPLLAAGPYFLLELSDPPPPRFEHELFEMRLRGYHPILAHVERERTFQQSPELLHRLVSQGALCQVTAMSVTGRFGRRAERAARAFLERRLVHFIGSDAHGSGRRPPGLRAAVAIAASILGGHEAAMALVDGNPAHVLRGDELEVEPPRPPRKGWFS